MPNILVIDKPVKIKSLTSDCDKSCSHIINSIIGYINESVTDDNALACIDFSKYSSFDELFNNEIGSKRRGEYRKCLKEGFYTRSMKIQERNDRRDELYSIHTSTDYRQGKMREEFYKYPEMIKEGLCNIHKKEIFGVFDVRDNWIGYINPIFAGEAARTYEIMGNASNFGRSNFMLLLMMDLVKYIYEKHAEVKYLIYHMMYVGNQGLQDWKRHAGFKPTIFNGGVEFIRMEV